MKCPAIIVDIDGTMMNCTHRRHYLEKKPKDWKMFNREMDKDTINNWCADLVWSVKESLGWQIVFCTGRHEEHRKVTEAILNWSLRIPDDYKLVMRKDGDYRDDSIVKKELYAEFIEPFYSVQFAIDDRQRVVDAWRELGLVCLQCAKGDF